MTPTNVAPQVARDLVLPTALGAAIGSVLLWTALFAVEREARPDVFASVPATIGYTATYALTLGQGAPEPDTLPGKVLLAALLLTWAALAGVVAGTLRALLRRPGGGDRPCPTCDHGRRAPGGRS